MSGDNPRLILEGRKTQTRRILRVHMGGGRYWTPLYQVELQPDGTWRDSRCDSFRCPYGVVGDRFWVRETWAAPTCYDDEKPRDLPATLAEGDELIYRAESPDYQVRALGSFWRSPLFMPRWASRITLEIVNVRVERLQDISEEDARVEGVKPTAFHDPLNYIGSFAALWESLHDKGAWDKNPWVWVIEFRKINNERNNDER